MNILIDNMQWVLLVCGLMTASLVQGIVRLPIGRKCRSVSG